MILRSSSVENVSVSRTGDVSRTGGILYYVEVRSLRLLVLVLPAVWECYTVSNGYYIIVLRCHG